MFLLYHYTGQMIRFTAWRCPHPRRILRHYCTGCPGRRQRAVDGGLLRLKTEIVRRFAFEIKMEIVEVGDKKEPVLVGTRNSTGRSTRNRLPPETGNRETPWIILW